MPLTLGQAAKSADRSKATILEAIRKGRISATKDDLGRWQIDPAELHRVFEPTSNKTDGLNDSEPHQTNGQTAEIERLKATVEGLERLCSQIEGERDSLREQNTRLTAILTDQRQNQTPPAKHRWWSFGKR